jgi:glutamate racemase
MLPRESFVYLADRVGFPYGTKPREEVRDSVLRLVSGLVDAYSPKAILIACNTASQAALEAARKSNPGIAIVGTVPAVKPAAERSRSGVIGVMASAGALEDPYLDALVARHARGVIVLREAAQELVSFVERRFGVADAKERREAVEPYVRRLVEGGADEIVLACTHFLHLRDDIAAAAGPGVEVVDSRAGVVKRLRQVLSERGLLNGRGRGVSEAAKPYGIFLLTGTKSIEAEYAFLARSFGLNLPESFSGQ